jgi:cytochrome c biogenesis protein CcdA
MIAAFAEGIAQSLLPCSWILLLPAIVVGLGTRRAAVFGVFTGSVVLTAWIVVVGWFVASLWLAGAVLVAGGLLWWRFGATYVPAALVGIGSAWAWQPCVGPELGDALTTAQHDPVAAIGGLAMFLLGVLVVGLGIGSAGGVVLERLGEGPSERAGAAVIGALGLTMVVGLYPAIASELAQWSTTLWA